MTTTVEVGQVWADNDPRGYGRKLRVVEVDQTHATVEAVADQRGRRTRIRLDRFRQTANGYRLVEG